MPSIESLPEELMADISTMSPFRTRVAMSTLCKSMRAAITPTLYRDIVVLYDGRPGARNLTLLLRTLLENPRYITYTKRFALRSTSYLEFPKQKEPCNPLSSDVLTEPQWQSLRKETEQILMGDDEEWTSAMRKHLDPVALGALIVVKLHRLESLTVEADPTPQQWAWFARVFRHSRSSGYLRNLSELNLGGSVDDGLPQDLTLLAFSMSKLARIKIRGPIDLRKTDKRPRSTPDVVTAGNLKTLELMDTTCHPEMLCLLLKENIQLTYLTYDCYFPSSYGPYDLDNLRKALSQRCGTLTHLTIKYDVYADEALEVESLVTVLHGELGSLRSFKTLVELEISLFVLFSGKNPQEAPSLVDVLPPQLQQLTINDDLWGYDTFHMWTAAHVLAVLSAFFGDSNGVEPAFKLATPHLHKITFKLRDTGFEMMTGWNDELIQDLRELCRAQGINCSILFDGIQQT